MMHPRLPSAAVPRILLIAGLAIGCGTPAHGVETGEQLLLLTNGEVLRGEIDARSDQFLVRLANRGQLVVDRVDVLYLASSLRDAYRHLRAQLDEPYTEWDRVRLANWCLVHELHDECAQVLKELGAQRIHDPRLEPLQSRLRAARSTSSSIPQPPRPAAASPRNQMGELLSQELATEFSTFVQPLLLNSCVRCHHAAQETTFTLDRPQRDGHFTARMTQDNLLAVLAAMDEGYLLTACQQPHGQGPRRLDEAPSRRWRHGQLERLTAWVQSTTTYLATTATPLPAQPAEAAALDPFDPTEFNRQQAAKQL